MEVLATGHISLVDINDAIVSDVPPADPSLGALWIDTTKDPNTLNSWDGTNWVEQSLSISSLDPSFYQDVEKLKDFADKAGSDGIISSGEKANIKLILMEITGDVLSGQTLPTLTTIDTAKGGQVYLARAEARASGIPITHADYTAFETAYSDLKTYLESLTPRPWLTGDTTIDPITWTAKWDAYYEKLSRLAVATSTYLANSIRPGEDYNGVTINTDKGIVVLRGDNLFRTILNATEGISIEKNNAGTWNKMFYTNLDGKIYAHGLVISSDSTIAGTDAATIKDNAAKGKAGIDELTSDLKVTPVEKAQLSREWEAIKAEYTQVLAQATSLGVTTSTYTTSYTNLDGVTPKIASEVLATMTTTYTFASASARDAFRTKINSYFAESEKIKKAINDAINKAAKDAEKNAKDYTNVIASNESSYINKNYNFADWTGSLPNGYIGLMGTAPTKVASENGNGNSVKFTTAAGQSGYFNTNTMNKPFYEYAYIEATFKLESGSINAAGVLFRYWRADGKSIYWDNAFKFKDVIPNPVLNKWYTVSKVIKVPTTDDFGGYGIFPMASWSTIDPTMPANVLHFDSVITRPATEQEISAYESKLAIADMTSDMKITPLEKQTLSRDWESIKAEYTQTLALANSLSVSATAYTTAYSNLDSVSPKIASEILANMNTTYAFATAAARDLFKTQMNAYFSESEKIKKAISDAINKSANNANDKIDNLKIGSRNIVRKKQLMAVNAASSSYDEPTNTWTITANDGAGGSWGAGVRITDKLSVVPIGSWFTASFEVYSPVDITWNNDTNNFPIGTSSGSNDNDEVALRKNSGRNIKANTWTKCWFSYKNKDSSTTELYDQSNIGIVNNTGAPVTFKIRNVKGELGNIPTDFTFAQEDLDEAIAKISFSGRNLILNSNQDYSTTGYLVNQYMLSEDWITGQEYTFVIKGSVPQGQTLGIWQNGGSTNVGHATTVYINGVTYVTFKAAATTSGNERKLSLYNYPSNTTQANVDWVALYKGNKPMDWMIAPEDIETIINLQSSGAANMFRNSGNFRNLNGWILNGGKSLKVGQKDGFTVLEAVGSITSTNHVTREMLKPSTEYVYSVEIMFSKDTNIDNTKPIHHWFFDTGGNYNAVDSYVLISSDKVAKANTWTRVSILFKTKATITSAAYFKAFVYDNVQLTDDNMYWVKNVMFSETNRIVNWSASLADIEELVASVPFVGRNLFLNASLLQGSKYWYSNVAQTEIITDGSDIAFKFVPNLGSKRSGIYQRQGGVSTGALPFDANQDYTVSVTMKSSASAQKVEVGAEGIKTTMANVGTEWQDYSFTFKGTGAGNGTVIFYGIDALDGTQFFIKKMKLEKGTKKTDFSVAPEDTDQAIAEVKSSVADMTSDMKITPLEKQTLSRDWESIKAEYSQVVSQGQAISGVSTTAYTTAYNNLDSVSPKIASEVLANMNTTYTFASTAARDLFKTQINKYFDEAEKVKRAIAETTNDLNRELTQAISTGRMLHNDPIFKNGTNNVLTYNNSGGSAVTVTRIAKPSDAPTTSSHAMEIKTTGAASPGHGGYVQFLNSRSGAKFLVRIIAKIPVGYSLNTATNSMGTGYTDRILTSNKGTGKFEEYIRLITCGTTGTFSNGGHFYLTGGPTATPEAPVTWQVAFATAYDVGDADYTVIDSKDKWDSAVNDVKQGQAVVNSTFSNWTQAFPAGIASWSGSSVSKETTLTRTGSAMRFDVSSDTAQIGAQITTGFFIPNLPNNKYYVVELDFMLVSGSITGACVLLDWNSMSPSRASIHLSDVVPAPTLGKWYTVRAVMKRPTDNLSGYSAMAGYLLANYSGSTTNKVKNIIFDRLVFREPTQQEIDAYEITTIENGVTVIDGGKLKTNSVKAESVDARRLRVTNNSGLVTLEITNTGEVTVNGTVHINSNTMFADGFDPSKNEGGRNILLNSRFATADATSWNNWGSPSVRQIEDITDLPGFDKAVKLTTTANNQGFSQSVPVVNGKTYTVSCYAKSASGQPVLQIYDGVGYPSVVMNSADVGKNKWVKMYFVFTAKASTVRLDMGKSAGGTLGTYWFTGIKLEEGDKTTGWTPANEDIDGLIGKVVTPNGDIKALDIASSMSVTPGAIDVVSKNINLKGKVTFSDFASGWALDSKGNKISNSDQPGYDPAKPLYLDMDGNYRPLSDEKNFMSNLFTKDDTNGVTVIDGNYIKTGTIQAKYANFRDVQVYNDSGQLTFHIDTNGNLSTSGTSQSIGYERQKKGWKIDADGSAEFNAATFRGDIELGYYNAPTDSFVVTGGLLSSIGGTGKDLRFWAGANKSTAPFKVFSDGTLEATKGYFTGTFSGEVVVGNISIRDTATKGDAKIILTDDSKIQKVVLGESAVELNTKTTFGNFLTIDITNQKLDFGANDFGIDYKNNTIRMKSFSLKGTTALEFVSDGSSGDDFVFKNVTGDTSVRVDGSFIARDDIEITNVLRMKKSTDSGNKGIDYVFI
ncbi:phage head spike fiber domain-containing protein [Bacillus wiedmannii]|uniref:phage head spike fiber domain-containing protein n=1 Tax=Bacillus wiedmannii TaxID=1890302 RepID=UPI00211D5636|nr:carbohydrate binding domain-containing protein [Bacillus wiedmannii]